MPRIIKFRARHKETGEWYYGSSLITDINQGDDYNLTLSLFWLQVEKGWLDPETVGQYTGLKDKNGKEIWEGDIIDYGGFGAVEVKLGWYDNGELYENRNAGYGWYLEGRNTKHPYRQGIDYMDGMVQVGKFERKVIGNIKENPELKETTC